MLEFLAAAREQIGGNYYQRLLVEVLEEQVRARAGSLVPAPQGNAR